MAKKNSIHDFINIGANNIFPDLPGDDARKECGMITQKQIRYLYVLMKQYDIEKEDLENYDFHCFDSMRARNFIDIIKEGRFYCFDIDELDMGQEERQNYLRGIERIQNDNMDLNGTLF